MVRVLPVRDGLGSRQSVLDDLSLPGGMALLEYVIQITHTYIATSLTNRSFQARCARNNQALVSTSPSRRAGSFDAPYHFVPSLVSLTAFRRSAWLRVAIWP